MFVLTVTAAIINEKIEMFNKKANEKPPPLPKLPSNRYFSPTKTVVALTLKYNAKDLIKTFEQKVQKQDKLVAWSPGKDEGKREAIGTRAVSFHYISTNENRTRVDLAFMK